MLNEIMANVIHSMTNNSHALIQIIHSQQPFASLIPDRHHDNLIFTMNFRFKVNQI